MTRIVVDKAGATGGGARRFLLELLAYLEEYPRPEVSLIGGDNLTSRWLLERELVARGAHRIALNNASFWAPGGRRTVLLRNALHFASVEEFSQLGYTPSDHMRKQIPVIRALAHRADRIIVPCDAMAERVGDHCPRLKDRIEVRMHPVSPRLWEGMASDEQKTILVPIVPQSYKRLDLHLPRLLDVVKDLDVRVVMTALPGEISEAERYANYCPIGIVPAEELASWWGRATAVFFPPALESFGYALAEARCGGRRVIAPNTAQNRQIAGQALAGYGDGVELATAVEQALIERVEPDAQPFDPKAYFEWLLASA